VPAAKAGQPLVQPADRPPQGRQAGRALAGKGRADVVIAPGPVGLDTAETLLVAVVDRRRAGHGEQDRQHMSQMALVGQPAGDPRDIVVADERQREKVLVISS